jgi:phosphoglycerol transferase MdoB-like AlkP superfamily enzyme
MKQRLKVFGLLALLWVVFFELVRIIFFLYQFPLTQNLTLYEVWMPIWLGLRMDLAMAGYWLIMPGLVLTTSFFIAEKPSKLAIIIVFYILSIFSSSIVVADLELYRHWNFRMDTTPFLYTGSAGINSISFSIIFLLLIIFLSLLYFLHWAFKKFILSELTFTPGSIKSASLMFICVALLFVPIRSSLRVAPLNTGVVYFHQTNSFPNHAGINVVWNFLKSVSSSSSFKYPTNLVDQLSANEIFTEMMLRSDSTEMVINQAKPNILLIILESFTADVVEPLGGLPNIAPHLNKLCREGILFDQFYASGDRTDKGLIAILSGYPAQPKTSIIKFPNKTQSLPSLTKVLKRSNYHTSFVYGGDIGFANMESYLTISGFSHITSDNNFDVTKTLSKWGVYDQFVFDRLLHEADTAQVPFFKTMLSLTSHEPFDVPLGNPGTNEMEQFLYSVSYTDSCLGQFIQDAKLKPWWRNTLVVITADHGHRLPRNNPHQDKKRFKIPMIWTGGAIDSVRTISKIGSQTDIVNTLLVQLAIQTDEFVFSKNLLSQQIHPFAVYSFNNGFGYIDRSMETVYDFDLKNYLTSTSQSEKDLAKGKAYMQKLFMDYNKR